jgi:hypothetical protein
MTRRWLVVFAALPACEPNVVDAVREPPALPPPASAQPSPLETSLIHRYSFFGTGTVALDAKGAAHGEVAGTELTGSGVLELAGERSGQYVDLPNGIISGLSAATFEAWLTWYGGEPWQRLFDFGNSVSGEGAPGASGTSYLFLTSESRADTNRMITPALRAAFSTDGIPDEEACDGSAPLPIGVPVHVALVIDPATEQMSLYRDGSLLSTCPLTRPLSMIDDVNNWLGRSNFSADVELSASYDEFRIYAAALSAAQLEASFLAGAGAD